MRCPMSVHNIQLVIGLSRRSSHVAWIADFQIEYVLDSAEFEILVETAL